MGADLLVLTHIEVLGDVATFQAAWTRTPAHRPQGLLARALHREVSGRRLLEIQRWTNASAYEAWREETAGERRALFAAFGVRSAQSTWHALGEAEPT